MKISFAHTITSSIIALLPFLTPASAKAWEYPQSTVVGFPYDSGNGSKDQPYVISTAQHLANLSYIVNSGTTYADCYFTLTADINLNEDLEFWPDFTYTGTPKQWAPIGGQTRDAKFKGHFDGGGHTISGLFIDSPSYYNYNALSIINVGLFGFVEKGSVKNLKIDNSLIAFEINTDSYTDCYVGSIASMAKSTEIENCESNCHISITCPQDLQAEEIYIGGICGYTQNISITHCTNSGNITAIDNSHNGVQEAAGIVAFFDGTRLDNCQNNGNIETIRIRVAGICANLQGEGFDVFNLSNYGNITGGSGLISRSGNHSALYDSFNVGDIINGCGLIGESGFTKIYDCHNSGDIETDNSYNGDHNKGAGLIGYADALEEMSDCYNIGNIKGINGYGLIGEANALSSVCRIKNCGNKGTINVSGIGSGLVGYNNWVLMIDNCWNSADVTATRGAAGILCSNPNYGDDRYTDITNSYNTGNITSEKGNAAGIFAATPYFNQTSQSNIFGSIIDCHNSGNISGSEYVAGICCGSQTKAIERCYNEGSVTGSTITGGISDWMPRLMLNCYNIGAISGNTYTGGLAGKSFNESTIMHCFNYSTVSGKDYTAYIVPSCTSIEPANKVVIDSCHYLPTSDITPFYKTSTQNGCIFNATEMSERQFYSGEVCVLLNGDQNPTPWGQEPGKDKTPLLTGTGNPEILSIDPVISDCDEDLPVYDLMGHRYEKSQTLRPGIYICNGKKFIVQ